MSLCRLSKMALTFDDILKKHVGEFGKYQIMMVLLISTTNFLLCFTSMSAVFIADNPAHHCQLPMELQELNCSEQDIKNYALPSALQEGEETHDQCHLFKRSYANLTVADVCPFPEPSSTFDRNYSMEERIKCDTWHYDTSVYQSTVVTQWNLVCDRAWLAKNTAGLYMGARIVGTCVCGWLADR